MRPIDKFFDDAKVAAVAELGHGAYIVMGEIPQLEGVDFEHVSVYHPNRPDEPIVWARLNETDRTWDRVLSESFVRECMEGRLKDDREPAKILFDLIMDRCGGPMCGSVKD